MSLVSRLSDLVGSLSNRFEVLSGGIGGGGGGGGIRRSDLYQQTFNVDKSSDYGGSYSSYGVSGGGGSYNAEKDCCELVVDPLTFFTLLAFIVGGTAFLNVVVTMVLGRKRRRRRRRSQEEEGYGGGEAILDVLQSGRDIYLQVRFWKHRSTPGRQLKFCQFFMSTWI